MFDRFFTSVFYLKKFKEFLSTVVFWRIKNLIISKNKFEVILDLERNFGIFDLWTVELGIFLIAPMKKPKIDNYFQSCVKVIIGSSFSVVKFM